MKSITQTSITIVLTLIISFAPIYSHAEKKAPNFNLKHLLNNKEISLKQYQGKVVYLDFWASWCLPCLKSFPFMEKLQTQYGSQDLVILAINLDENIEDAKIFVKENPSNFFVGHNTETDIANLYKVQVMPSSFLIDRNGFIKAVHRGFKNSDKEKLKKLISDTL